MNSICNETNCTDNEVNTTTTTDGGNSRLDESLWDLPGSDALAGIIATLYMVIFLVAFSWNLFVIVFMLKHRQLLKEPSSIFLFCLVIVDFMEAVSSIPFYIATLIGGGWIFGDTDEMREDVCSAVGFFLSTFLSLSIHILAIIAFDRFLYIACALNYHKLLQPWKAWLLVIVCCIPAVIVASTPLYGFGEFFFFNEFGVCLFHWRGQRSYVIVFCLENMVFITAIILFTTLTYCYIRRFLRIRQKREVKLSNTNLNNIQLASRANTEEERVSKEHRSRQKILTRLFIALMVMQLVCFTPALLTAFIGFVLGSYDDVPNIVFFIDLLFVISNAAINPIILTCVRRTIRHKIKSMLMKLWMRLRCVSADYGFDPDPTQDRPSFNRQVTIESVLNGRGHRDSRKHAPTLATLGKQTASDSGNSSGSSAGHSPCEYIAYHSPTEAQLPDGFMLPAADSKGTMV